MRIPGSDERWENWVQFAQSRLVPKFTELGFKVAAVPPHVHERLAAVVHEAVDSSWDVLEDEDGVSDAIYNRQGRSPKMVSEDEPGNRALWEWVHRELLPLHEEWSGLRLFPTSIYGVRLYQNTSSLIMHVDKPHSHVISSIVHIAHQYDDDAAPWPIDVEDTEGRLHSVSLEPGQMLFYESAKCVHGRMSELRGKYYGSIFVHYQPVSREVWPCTLLSSIESIPWYWSMGAVDAEGSRWAGQAITVDSMVAANAPPREVQNVREYEEYLTAHFDADGLFIRPPPREPQNVAPDEALLGLLRSDPFIGQEEVDGLERARQHRLRDIEAEERLERARRKAAGTEL
jgi:hypothetical protein